METVQEKMVNHLNIAVDRFKTLSLNEKRLAERQIKNIISLKHEMETIAAGRGYSRACKSSIPVCKGDCCKWHFPRSLKPVDFLIAVFFMSGDQIQALTKQVLNNKKSQCPILRETGCFLSFEQRPIPCTNAYPCFADRSYWVEKEKINAKFKKAIKILETRFFRLA